ncbi:helix-turn-helix domain-containing protein [Intestinibacter bartlettii]|uniref:Helix-turn-helix domain-containing protein n=1 Tax=Intestinibacter bartlettii TaxID=261299 RepID=A0ABS8CYA1_9FIRM|nr:helix-turn-helix domain-containing protein [Intestinibacter bartlettii]MCB5397630.1 helix-turn-helix domain-containing protein [Intestinibacter bartlettii]MCB5404940.1 helix-turn-helix domain-containing protein [Intestinibacter bartlettii]MCB5446442.1 helix-turn-helix domain-containing protein [Intestinibacter bartlettii]MCB5749169.1 helix-turn-helix domain-containing protein [Intestinibacter bartlettii]
MKKTMSVKEFSKLYNIGMNNAYKIVNTSGFPAIRVGRKIIIIRDQVDKWMLEKINTTIN